MSEVDKVKQELIELLDQLLNQDYWNETPFLSAAYTRLKNLRDEFAEKEELAKSSADKSSQVTKYGNGCATHLIQEVYVALYQTDGNNLAKWEQLLQAISNHSISRPIYQNEQDIKKVLRAIAIKHNHAYIAVKIRQQDIIHLPEEQRVRDKLGHPLLLLQERAVSKLNITRFVHVSGEYRLEGGRLVKVKEVSFHE